MTIPIPPALRADLDRELSGAIDGLLGKAADLDDLDIIDANVELMNDLADSLTADQLAAAAAAFALRLHRSGGS